MGKMFSVGTKVQIQIPEKPNSGIMVTFVGVIEDGECDWETSKWNWTVKITECDFNQSFVGECICFHENLVKEI